MYWLVLTLASDSNRNNQDDENDCDGHHYYDAYIRHLAVGSGRQKHLLSGS